MSYPERPTTEQEFNDAFNAAVRGGKWDILYFLELPLPQKAESEPSDG